MNQNNPKLNSYITYTRLIHPHSELHSIDYSPIDGDLVAVVLNY